LPDKPSLIVLPLTNMSSDPEQEYFSDGLTEILTSDLSRISSLFVISRNTAFSYKGKPMKAQDVSKELGVRYVLEGSVQKAGEQVRIVVQLIDASQNYQVWTQRYDRPLKDIFALQDEIVQKIVTTLKLQLTLQEQGIVVRKHTDNLEAYDFFLRGVESVLRFTKEAILQARQMFEKAIALDPQYAAAYAALGMTYWMEWFSPGSSDPQGLERAFELAQQALTLDESLPGAYLTLARVYLYKKQHTQALAEAERALARDPNGWEIHMTLGDILFWMEQPEKALRRYEQALRLNPPCAICFNDLGLAYLWLRQYEEAIGALQKALTLNPTLPVAHLNLAVVYSELGREAEAQAEMAALQQGNPNANPTVVLEVVKQKLPFQNPAATERYVAALRKAAGLK
jgi:TolB-like protein/Tfp pilus assembly protein PilF